MFVNILPALIMPVVHAKFAQYLTSNAHVDVGTSRTSCAAIYSSYLAALFSMIAALVRLVYVVDGFISSRYAHRGSTGTVRRLGTAEQVFRNRLG